ncbi:MAG: hypothetical protein ACLFSY_04855 [Desulfonatronovibrionaceae bacterium]
MAAGTVNVDKLKSDAFSAIDALFSDEQSSPDPQEENESPSFARLEEYILALDWECTDKDIRELLELVNGLQSSTEDKNTLTLLKILKNTLTYLSRAGSNAHPETLRTAAEVVSGLNRVYNKDDPRAAAQETRRLYNQFKELKQKISEYNQKLRTSSTPSFTPEKEAAGKVQATKPEVEEKVPPRPAEETRPPAPEVTDSELKGELKLIRKELEHLQKRQSRLEDLVHRMFSGESASAGSASEDSRPAEEENEESFDFLSADIDLGTREEAEEEEVVPENAAEEEHKEGDSLESVAYVQVFTLGSDLIAMPSEYINNTFKLSGKLKKKVHSQSSIPLKELASLFRKLSSNMKGSLRGTPERKLRKINASVQHIDPGLKDPKNAVLCTCPGGPVLFPVTAPHSGNLFLVTEMQREPNNYSEYAVQIESLGTVPVYIPC